MEKPSVNYNTVFNENIFEMLYICCLHPKGFPGGTSGKEHACQCRRHETQVPSLGWEDPLEEGMATHSSILAWRIPWTEDPGSLQSIRLLRA